MSKNREMRGGLSSHISWLWFIAMVLSCSPASRPVQAEPEPIPPSLTYTGSFADDAESFLLLQRLKQIAESKVIEEAREYAEEQMELQAMLEAEAEARRNQRDYSAEVPEMLPIPSAIVHHGPVHSGKRTSYMTLCHFKICNMGRKRQL